MVRGQCEWRQTDARVARGFIATRAAVETVAPGSAWVEFRADGGALGRFLGGPRALIRRTTYGFELESMTDRGLQRVSFRRVSADQLNRALANFAAQARAERTAYMSERELGTLRAGLVQMREHAHASEAAIARLVADSVVAASALDSSRRAVAFKEDSIRMMRTAYVRLRDSLGIRALLQLPREAGETPAEARERALRRAAHEIQAAEWDLENRLRWDHRNRFEWDIGRINEDLRRRRRELRELRGRIAVDSARAAGCPPSTCDVSEVDFCRASAGSTSSTPKTSGGKEGLISWLCSTN